MRKYANDQTVTPRAFDVSWPSGSAGLLRVFIHSQRMSTPPLCGPRSNTSWPWGDRAPVPVDRDESQYHPPWETGDRGGSPGRSGDAHSTPWRRPTFDRSQVSPRGEGVGQVGRTPNRGRPLQQEEVDALQSHRLGRSNGGQGIRYWPRHDWTSFKKNNFALRTCCKRFTGPPHPDRNKQFEFIQKQKKEFLQQGQPVISTDAKKKELIGNFANPGRTWGRRAKEVNAHDFRGDADALAAPYGIYNVENKQGHIRLGISHDTPRFAVACIRYWWEAHGKHLYPNCRNLLLLCDAGGSNSCRSRVWKYELQTQLVDPHNIAITVCHYPRGASKWNPVEHRLFSFVSNNWRGEPLTTLGKMLSLIRGTKGVDTTASLDRHQFPLKEKISAEQMATLNITRHRVCPDWNYTIAPRVNRSLKSDP